MLRLWRLNRLTPVNAVRWSGHLFRREGGRILGKVPGVYQNKTGVEEDMKVANTHGKCRTVWYKGRDAFCMVACKDCVLV